MVAIQSGAEGCSYAESQNFEINNHPSELYAYTTHWGVRKKAEAVQYMRDQHSFVIEGVSIITGMGDSNNSDAGVNDWSILFCFQSGKVPSYQAVLSRTMLLLGKIRAAGWKRYVATSDPRLSGKATTVYALSQSSVIYSLDSTHTLTMEEWTRIVASEPEWDFYDNDVFLCVTMSYQVSGANDGHYLMDFELETYSQSYLSYFSRSAQKKAHWRKYLLDALKPAKESRLTKEAGLKAKNSTIDTSYEDHPLEAI